MVAVDETLELISDHDPDEDENIKPKTVMELTQSSLLRITQTMSVI